MRLGIDLDDTLTKTTITANDYLHHDFNFKQVADYHELPDIELPIFIKKYVLKIIVNSPCHENAQKVINNLLEKGHKIIFITARSNKYQNCEEATLKYLKNNNIKYDKIIFNQENKVLACKEENIDLFLDDKEIVLDELKKNGIKTLRYKNDLNNSKHPFINDWLEYEKYVDDLERKEV